MFGLCSRISENMSAVPQDCFAKLAIVSEYATLFRGIVVKICGTKF